MTTGTVARNTTRRSTMVHPVKHAIEDWLRRIRASREKSQIEEWNMDYRAKLDRHGVSSYK